MPKPLTQEALLRAVVTIQAHADAFARSMADTIAELEREGISSATAMAKALNERGVATARRGRWAAQTVIALRRRLKRLEANISNPSACRAWPSAAGAPGGPGVRADMPRGKPLTTEARLKGRAIIQANADAFARSMAGTIAELEREGISANAMAKALNERGVPTPRSGRWQARTVMALRRRLKRLGL
jgi:hypothetical protein